MSQLKGSCFGCSDIESLKPVFMQPNGYESDKKLIEEKASLTSDIPNKTADNLPCAKVVAKNSTIVEPGSRLIDLCNYFERMKYGETHLVPQVNKECVSTPIVIEEIGCCSNSPVHTYRTSEAKKVLVISPKLLYSSGYGTVIEKKPQLSSWGRQPWSSDHEGPVIRQQIPVCPDEEQRALGFCSPPRKQKVIVRGKSSSDLNKDYLQYYHPMRRKSLATGYDVIRQPCNQEPNPHNCDHYKVGSLSADNSPVSRKKNVNVSSPAGTPFIPRTRKSLLVADDFDVRMLIKNMERESLQAGCSFAAGDLPAECHAQRKNSQPSLSGTNTPAQSTKVRKPQLQPKLHVLDARVDDDVILSEASTAGPTLLKHKASDQQEIHTEHITPSVVRMKDVDHHLQDEPYDIVQLMPRCEEMRQQVTEEMELISEKNSITSEAISRKPTLISKTNTDNQLGFRKKTAVDCTTTSPDSGTQKKHPLHKKLSSPAKATQIKSPYKKQTLQTTLSGPVSICSVLRNNNSNSPQTVKPTAEKSWQDSNRTVHTSKQVSSSAGRGELSPHENTSSGLRIGDNSPVCNH